jgi:hypothetical protein
MNDDLERFLKREVVAKLRYYPGICLERLKKTMKDASQNT